MFKDIQTKQKGVLNMFKKRKMIKHHTFGCLNLQEKTCIAGMICCALIRGICIGFYLSEK